MPTTLKVAALGLVFDDTYLLTPSGKDHGTLDLRTLNRRRANGRVQAVVDEQYLVKDNCITLLKIRREFLNRDHVALLDDVLLPAGLDDGHFHM